MESCRRAVKERLLKDIVGGVNDGTGGGWHVLVLDDFTTRLLSCTCKMSDVMDCNVSVVENIAKVKEPLPQAAIYFLQPVASSVTRLCQDFESTALYPSVHVFFTSKLSSEGLARIKATEPLIRVLKTLKEVNLEFMTVDSRTAVTNSPHALITLMGDQCEADRATFSREVDMVSTRITTLFATLNEFPLIRYRVGRQAEAGDPPGQTVRSLLCQTVSARLIEKLSVLQRSGALPPKETCDLLVLDRSYDAVAPFIHEWSYEALVEDLVTLDNHVYRYTAESNSGKTDEREVIIDEHDEVWRDLRHKFIADVYSGLAARFKDFQTKNKAAKLGSSGVKGEMSTTNIRALIQALPQFREVLSRLAVHIQLSSDIKTATNQRGLTEVGELEQDLVLGDKTSKELNAFLTEHPDVLPEDKMRLLLCYLATHPGKLDDTKRTQWAKLAGFAAQDMQAIANLEFMGVKMAEAGPEAKSGFFSKKAKPAKATRKKREDDGEEYALNRFQPLLLDLLEELSSGRLSPEEYPYIRPPMEDSAPAVNSTSARTARGGLNWTRRPGSESAPARRVVVLLLGGATHGEMRVVHRVAAQTGRDVILATTGVHTPREYLEMLYQLRSE